MFMSPFYHTKKLGVHLYSTLYCKMYCEVLIRLWATWLANAQFTPQPNDVGDLWLLHSGKPPAHFETKVAKVPTCSACPSAVSPGCVFIIGTFYTTHVIPFKAKHFKKILKKAFFSSSIKSSHHGLSYFHLNNVLVDVIPIILAWHTVIDVVLTQVMLTAERKKQCTWPLCCHKNKIHPVRISEKCWERPSKWILFYFIFWWTSSG